MSSKVGRSPLKAAIWVRVLAWEPYGRLNDQGSCPLAKRSALNGVGIVPSVFRHNQESSNR